MAFKRTDQTPKRTLPDGVPEDAIPADEVSLGPPPKNEDMINLRLNSERHIHAIWRELCGRTYKEIDGRAYLIRVPFIEPVVNDAGAVRITQWVRAVCNPDVRLGHTTDDEARILTQQFMNDVAEVLSNNAEKYGIKSIADQKEICSRLRLLVWHSLTRAVDGRESEALITNIQEQRGTQEIKQSVTTAGKGLKWPRRQEPGQGVHG